MHTDADVNEYFPAGQSKHSVGPGTNDNDQLDHVPVKPLKGRLPSDVNITFINPVDELYTLDESTDDPERAATPTIESVLHSTVSHW